MTPLFTTRTICVLTILWSGSLEAAPLQAQDRAHAMGTPGSEAIIGADIAVGATEDTLRACMARIPKDASIGQVMIAEQSCWRDEHERKPLQEVPEARRTSGGKAEADREVSQKMRLRSL